MSNKYFINKICTVLTTSTSFGETLSKIETANIFTGTVLDINNDGVFLSNLNGLKSFFYHNHIIAILEERVVRKEDVVNNKEITMDILGDLVR